MQQQSEKAKRAITQPSKNKKFRFTKSNSEKLELNEALIAKTQKLPGIKGYYTNPEETKASSQLIVERYHTLYRIEQAFRISKHDLQIRPISHHKAEPIQLHLFICFMALAASKHIELITGTSINRFLKECRKVQDARIPNKITAKEINIRTKYTPEIIHFIEKLNLPH
jgi:transposase